MPTTGCGSVEAVFAAVRSHEASVVRGCSTWRPQVLPKPWYIARRVVRPVHNAAAVVCGEALYRCTSSRRVLRCECIRSLPKHLFDHHRVCCCSCISDTVALLKRQVHQSIHVRVWSAESTRRGWPGSRGGCYATTFTSSDIVTTASARVRSDQGRTCETRAQEGVRAQTE